MRVSWQLALADLVREYPAKMPFLFGVKNYGFNRFSLNLAGCRKNPTKKIIFRFRFSSPYS